MWKFKLSLVVSFLLLCTLTLCAEVKVHSKKELQKIFAEFSAQMPKKPTVKYVTEFKASVKGGYTDKVNPYVDSEARYNFKTKSIDYTNGKTVPTDYIISGEKATSLFETSYLMLIKNLDSSWDNIKMTAYPLWYHATKNGYVNYMCINNTVLKESVEDYREFFSNGLSNFRVVEGKICGKDLAGRALDSKDVANGNRAMFEKYSYLFKDSRTKNTIKEFSPEQKKYYDGVYRMRKRNEWVDEHAYYVYDDDTVIIDYMNPNKIRSVELSSIKPEKYSYRNFGKFRLAAKFNPNLDIDPETMYPMWAYEYDGKYITYFCMSGKVWKLVDSSIKDAWLNWRHKKIMSLKACSPYGEKTSLSSY